MIIRQGPPCSRGSGSPSHVCTSSTSSSTARASGRLVVYGNAGARRVIVAGAQHELRVRLRHRELGERPEAHAAPVIVEAAPRRHAVEVAHVVHLRQREKLLPGERQRILDEAADLERPVARRDRGLVSEVEHRPVAYLVLTHRQARHAVAIERARTRRASVLRSGRPRRRGAARAAARCPSTACRRVIQTFGLQATGYGLRATDTAWGLSALGSRLQACALRPEPCA